VLRVAGGDIRFHGGHTIRRTIEGNIHAYSAPRRRILAPVIDLLNAALKADNGQLFAAEVAKLSQAVNDAIAKVTVALPVTPPTAAAPGTPATPSLSATPTVPSPTKYAERQDALTALRRAVDALVAAVTSGDATQVVPTANAVVTALAHVVAGVLGGTPVLLGAGERCLRRSSCQPRVFEKSRSEQPAC
jgi:hypothetical protein